MEEECTAYTFMNDDCILGNIVDPDLVKIRKDQDGMIVYADMANFPELSKLNDTASGFLMQFGKYAQNVGDFVCENFSNMDFELPNLYYIEIVLDVKLSSQNSKYRQKQKLVVFGHIVWTLITDHSLNKEKWHRYWDRKQH